MALVGSTYIQSSASDPGAVGFGYSWAQTDTGSLYYRNTTNTAWVLAGNENQTYMGLLNRGGGTMTGAILGAHGLMPTSGGDFSVAPTILGNAIATQAYVDTQIASLQTTVSTQIAQAIASIPGLAVSSKLAISAGYSSALTISGVPTGTASFTIPLPTYSDGSTAAQAEVNGRYAAWIAAWNWGDASTGTSVDSWSIAESSPGSRVYTITFINNSGVSVPLTFPVVGYIIMGVRS